MSEVRNHTNNTTSKIDKEEFREKMGLILQSTQIAGLDTADAREFIDFKLYNPEPRALSLVTIVQEDDKVDLYVNTKHIGEVEDFYETMNNVTKNHHKRNALNQAPILEDDKTYQMWVNVSNPVNGIACVTLHERAFSKVEMKAYYEKSYSEGGA